jgi:hypothetical protein
MLKEKFQNEHETLLNRSFEVQFGNTRVSTNTAAAATTTSHSFIDPQRKQSSVDNSARHIQGPVVSPGGDDTSVVTMSSIEGPRAKPSSKSTQSIDLKFLFASTTKS